MNFIVIPIRILFSFIVAPIGKNKKVGFWGTFLWSLLLTPFLGLFIALGSAQKNPIGCPYCGNEENEAAFCGLCGKNQDGLTKQQLTN